MECHCFTCGWAGPFELMVSNLFGYEDDGIFGKSWLSKNFLTVAIENRVPLKINMSRGAVQKVIKNEGFTEEELQKYRWVHPYMYKRKLTDDLIEKFDVGYDERTNCITFPVYDEYYIPCFIARRSVATKFFHYPEDAEKPVYAAYLFMSGEYKYCVICESILNALTCWKYGIPAVALIGTGTDSQYEVLKNLPVRKYILATDPDKAGFSARTRLRRALQSTKILVEYDIPEGQDLNDLDDKILELNEFWKIS
jgi:DNA primase